MLQPWARLGFEFRLFGDRRVLETFEGVLGIFKGFRVLETF